MRLHYINVNLCLSLRAQTCRDLLQRVWRAVGSRALKMYVWVMMSWLKGAAETETAL